MNRYVHKIGDVVGRLTLLGRTPSDKHRRSKWRVRCECGAETEVRNESLGIRTNSCGCLHRERTKQWHASQNADAAFNRTLLIYRTGARNRKHAFELTPEQFREITSSACFYCGSEPSQIRKSKYKVYTYNGVDRKDNSLGYTLTNSLPCCHLCNKLKSDHEFDVFMNQVLKIAGRHS